MGAHLLHICCKKYRAMKLKIDNMAPFFEAEALTGKRVSLEDYRNKNLLIKFYRFATCPICNLHLRNLVRRIGPQLISKLNRISKEVVVSRLYEVYEPKLVEA